MNIKSGFKQIDYV